MRSVSMGGDDRCLTAIIAADAFLGRVAVGDQDVGPLGDLIPLSKPMQKRWQSF